MVPLASVVEIQNGSRDKGGALESGISSIGGEQIDEKGNIRFNKMKYVSEDHFRSMTKGVLRSGDVLIVKDGATTGKIGFFAHDIPAAVNEHVFILRAKESVEPQYLYRCVRAEAFQDKLRPYIKGIIGGISLEFGGITIPLPPLEVQKEIVAELEGYQKVIDGASAVLHNYRPHIPFHPEWPIVELAEVIEEKPKNGYSGKPVDRVTDTKVLTLSATTSGKLDLTKFKYLDEEIPLDAACRCRKGDIYLQRGNTAELVGTAAIFDVDESSYIYPDLMIRVRADESKVTSHYLLIALQSKPVRDFLIRNAVGAAGSMPKINQTIVERVPIQLPPLATQQAIVAEIEAEQALVAANRQLIARFENKIGATLARVWGEDEPTPAEA
jgi:type I restriction enzyme M protein